MKGIAKLTKKTAALLISIALLAPLTPAWAAPGLIGEGTETSPYMISTAEDLLYVSQQLENKAEGFASASYKLLNDIDLSGVASFNGIGQYDGDKSNWFHGHFDGAGHKILNYTSQNDSIYARAFFPYTSDGALIENLTFISPSVTNAYEAAVVTGDSYRTTIRNVKAYNAIVEAKGYLAGGIASRAVETRIEGCAFLDGTVSGVEVVGGIVGIAYSGSIISGCQFRGLATHNAKEIAYALNIGGVAGYMTSRNDPGYAKGAVIENCLASGSINASAYISGGIVARFVSDGSSEAKIINCISNMTITAGAQALAKNYAGGIVGMLDAVSPSVEGNIAFGESIDAVNAEVGRIYALTTASNILEGNIANNAMLINGALAQEGGINGIGVAKGSILDGSALPANFKKSPWIFDPGSLPYLFGNEEEAAVSEVILKAPRTIKGDKGTEFKAALWLGKWAEGTKALEAVLSIPDSLELVKAEASESLSSGSPSSSLDRQGKLRIVYMNTESNQISLILGQTIAPALEITLKLKAAMSEGDEISLSADSVRLIASASEDPITLDVSNASSTTLISKGGSENPNFKARGLYIGDGIDLIPDDKKAVAVEVSGLDEAVGLKLGDDQFFYAPEFELAMTYVALVSKEADLSTFEDYDNYTKDQNPIEIAFGKASGQASELNAQDALAILSFWLRKEKPESPKGILVSNVSADSRIDTIDALAVVERFVSQVPFAILSK